MIVLALISFFSISSTNTPKYVENEFMSKIYFNKWDVQADVQSI